MDTPDTPFRATTPSAPSSPLSDLGATPSLSILSSSPPLSVLSRSPSLPPQATAHLPAPTPDSPSMHASSRYPSPSSTTTTATTQSGNATPLKLQDSVEVGVDDAIEVCTDGQPPPAKRRRIAQARKPRTTEQLDLDNRDEEAEAQLDRLLNVLRRKKKIVVVAGAGISVSAGIPDFRSNEGLFKTLKEKHKIKGGGQSLFDASVYKDDKSTSEFHKMVRDLSKLTTEAKPTAFHHMLATIAHEGRLMRLYSQNVDCLETSLKPLATAIPLNTKAPWPTTVQLHGSVEKMQCTKCSTISSLDGSLFEGPEPPLCKDCEESDHVRTQFARKRSHGIGKLRPRMVLYNEYHPDQDAIGKVSQADLRRVPDAVIVVGTSMKVPGVRRIVKELCQATRAKRDGFTAWVNLDPVPQNPDLKNLWDLVVRGKCDDIATLLDLPHWDCEDIGPDKEKYMVSGMPEKEEQYEQRRSRDRLDVVLDSKKRSLDEFSDTESRASDLSDIKLNPIDKIQEKALPTPSASPRHGSPLSRKPLPKGKTTQSKLSFGIRPMDAAIAAVDTKKPAKRKAGRSKKDPNQKPKNEITNAFKATKGVPSVGKPTKEALRPIKNDCDPHEFDLKSDKRLAQLPSLRPDTKDNDHFIYKRAEASSSELSLLHSGASDSENNVASSPISRPQGVKNAAN